MPRKASIFVLAGVNGAGKSSVLGALVEALGAGWFNPDQAARQAREADPTLSQEQSNAWAWQEEMRLLDAALSRGEEFAFETTLGGKTVTERLAKALGDGHEVSVLFVGLSSPELHLARVKARVAKGGHDIPEAKIRERFDSSRENLVRLLPLLSELRVFDNSAEGDPASASPAPFEILHLAGGRLLTIMELPRVPAWAQPIVAAALRLPGDE